MMPTPGPSGDTHPPAPQGIAGPSRTGGEWNWSGFTVTRPQRGHPVNSRRRTYGQATEKWSKPWTNSQRPPQESPGPPQKSPGPPQKSQGPPQESPGPPQDAWAETGGGAR